MAMGTGPPFKIKVVGAWPLDHLKDKAGKKDVVRLFGCLATRGQQVNLYGLEGSLSTWSARCSPGIRANQNEHTGPTRPTIQVFKKTRLPNNGLGFQTGAALPCCGTMGWWGQLYAGAWRIVGSTAASFELTGGVSPNGKGKPIFKVAPDPACKKSAGLEETKMARHQ